MNTLERRVNRLELLLEVRKFYFNVMAWKRQQDAQEAERRRKAEEARAAAQVKWQEQRAAEEAARAAEPPRPEAPAEPRVVAPPPPPPEPEPPPMTRTDGVTVVVWSPLVKVGLAVCVLLLVMTNSPSVRRIRGFDSPFAFIP